VLCAHCRVEDPDILPETRQRITRDLGMTPDASVKLWKGKGCDVCGGTGYSGRLAIHEILRVDDDIRKLIMSHAPAEVIKRKAVERGMVTLLQDGWKKVLKGITRQEEVLQVAPPDPEALQTEAEEGEMESMFLESRPGETVKELSPERPNQEEKPTPAEDPARNTSGKDESLSERRKYHRVAAKIHVSYRVVDYLGSDEKVKKMKKYFENSAFEADTDNISAGGVMCVSPNWHTEALPGLETSEISVGDILKQGTLLELKINIPDGGQPVECMGKILHAQRLVETIGTNNRFSFRIGVGFLSINTVDRLRIEKFCKAKRV
jgi:hypothetical protein